MTLQVSANSERAALKQKLSLRTPEIKPPLVFQITMSALGVNLRSFQSIVYRSGVIALFPCLCGFLGVPYLSIRQYRGTWHEEANGKVPRGKKLATLLL